MKGTFRKAVAVVLAVSVSGCSLLVPHTQSFSARCSESDAVLFINQEKFEGQGTTTVKRNKNVSVMCTKDGFKPATAEAQPKLSGAGIADAIGTLVILLPGFGFLSPGAWRIETDNLNVPMERQAAP